MGKPDTATREFINDVSVFADVLNYYVFGGRQVVDPQNLEELDTSALLSVFGKDGDEETIQRYRDALKKATIMADDEAAYIVFGIEAQTHIDYGMPIRTFLYDGLQYDSQARKIKAAHRAADDKHSDDEFVSGLYKEDRILPVISVVIYFGSKPWDGAVRLRDLYKIKHQELIDLAPDYNMHLIEPARLADEDFEKFATSMGKVLKFMKLSGSKDDMRTLMETDAAYTKMDRKAARVLRECAKVSVEIDSDQEVVNVCKAWKDAQEEAARIASREAAVLTFIESARFYGVAENTIINDVMKKYKLTEEQVRKYMSMKGDNMDIALEMTI